MENDQRLTLQNCQGLLGQLIPRYKTVAIIIDALDECEDPMKLLDELAKLSSIVELFVSSRETVLVKDKLVPCRYIPISPGLSNYDLRFLIEREAKKMCAGGHNLGREHNEPLLDRLIKVLSDRGQGG